MNGSGKTPRKKRPPKLKKNSKNQNQIALCEQKTLAKVTFCSNTVFTVHEN